MRLVFAGWCMTAALVICALGFTYDISPLWAIPALLLATLGYMLVCWECL